MVPNCWLVLWPRYMQSDAIFNFFLVLCNLYLSSQLHVRYRLCKVILSICSVVCKETSVSLKSIDIIWLSFCCTHLVHISVLFVYLDTREVSSFFTKWLSDLINDDKALASWRILHYWRILQYCTDFHKHIQNSVSKTGAATMQIADEWSNRVSPTRGGGLSAWPPGAVMAGGWRRPWCVSPARQWNENDGTSKGNLVHTNIVYPSIHLIVSSNHLQT